MDNRECAHYSAVGQGYGYQIWQTEQGGFAFNGMGSQFTICVPEKDIIFVCTGDTQGNPRASNYIFNAFFDCIIDFAKDAPLPEEVLTKAWEPFFRADESRTARGTGLGLAITKQIVTLHGGTVLARNMNNGVQFTMTLPM